MAKKILSVVVLALVFVFALTSCNFKEKTESNLEKLEKLRTLVMSEEEFDAQTENLSSAGKKAFIENYQAPIIELLDDLGLYERSFLVKPEIKFTEADIKAYVENHSLEEFLILFKEATSSHVKYIPINWDFVGWCINIYPEKFTAFEELEENSDGFYTSNETAKPVSRTEAVTNTIENTYEVKYYGDIAIEHAKEWKYDEGMYEWIEGKFYDIPTGWKATERDNLYFKGNYVFGLNEKYYNIYTYISEETNTLFIIYSTDGSTYLHTERAE